MALYAFILGICFFLLLSFFLSPDSSDYAQETGEEKITKHQLVGDPPLLHDQSEITNLTAFYEQLYQELVTSAATFDGEVGITYVDLTTGKRLSINGEKEFYSASTIKVALAMMIADKVSAGELAWEEELIYDENTDYESGTGIIINAIQPAYTVQTLQEYAIIYSDNIAKNMLYDTFGGDVQAKQAIYARFLQKETDWSEAQFTSEDAADILTVLYDEKKTNTDYQQIYSYMKNTVFHERLETSLTQGKVAHKVGSYDQYIHDIGFLETEHPFILSVFTKSPSSNGTQFISTLVDKLWVMQRDHYPTKNGTHS